MDWPRNFPVPETRGSSLVGIPPGLVNSAGFHRHPMAVHIRGTRTVHAALFRRLSGVQNLKAASGLFQEYMEQVFLGGDRATIRTGRFRAYYLRLLRGWGYDCNSPEGAVMKAWAESRFGLAPTFHGEAIRRLGDAGWLRYTMDRMSARFDNNAIWEQLDVLFEFAQWAARRFLAPGRRHLRLYRGTNDFLEHPLLWKSGARDGVILLNNLVSFSGDREIAGMFGDIILEIEVPLVKLLFFNGLVPCPALHAENEFLVIGGAYYASQHY